MRKKCDMINSGHNWTQPTDVLGI